MAKGKRISTGQVRNLVGNFAYSIPDDLDGGVAQEWVDLMDKIMSIMLRIPPDEAYDCLLRMPANEEVFSLTVDGAPRKFKLVVLDNEPSDRQALRAAVEARGVLANEKVREIFSCRYPEFDGDGVIAFAPDSWKERGDGVGFPVWAGMSYLHFFWPDQVASFFKEGVRWLVEA